MAQFTHLHVHTEYSLLDGLCKFDKLIDRAMEYGMDSLAITDHGVMYGAVKFYAAVREAGLKPIIGVEAYMAARSRLDKQANLDADRFHLLLLSKDMEGYRNLMQLTTLAHLEGFYYKPRIDFEILEKYHQGVIATSACLQGQVPQLLLQRREKEAEEVARHFLKIFGDDFYLELQSHSKIPEQAQANEKLLSLSRKLGIPVVATNDVHYVDADDAEAQDALLAVQTQRKIADPDRLTMLDSPDFYLRSQEEMGTLFADCPDAIKNTQAIAAKCNLEIPIGKWILPVYPLPEGKTSEEHLKDLARERVLTRFPNPKKEILDRLEYELGIICDKGFATYFLIVQDFVNWAKQQGIRVGPGRGSAAGSLVAYSLRITSVDPLYHNLPFERFMSRERPTPPDIDLDFADDRRDEVIEYVSEKYGKDKVAQIITFGTMESRQAVRDIGRVLGMPYSEPDKIAKLLPPKTHIAEALKTVPELEQFYRQPEYKKLLDLAQKVEGVSRHASVHAAGVVVADKPLTYYTPIQKEAKGEKIITQYDMYSLDRNVSDNAIGLLKIDFLGLRNLTILETARQYIKNIRGVEVDISEIPLEDKDTLKMIASGQTTGVFQLESAGMRKLARKLQPTRFSDISAMVALYRPGPMQFIDEFIAGKKNPKKIHYPHPTLEPILSETYGIIVYQEQVLLIANVMGGYSLGEADILRRAIGKKKKAIMMQEKKTFADRAVKLGYKKETVDEVWSFIEKFARYGFNKAHSASYATIAFQTAFLKAHYPVEFMTALLTVETAASSGPAKDQKMNLAIEECRRLGAKVLPPQINHSRVGFSIEEVTQSFQGKAIRFGFSAIKNVGEAAIGAILAAREAGDFLSLADFCRRVDSRKVNKKVVESLIRSGAMDCFGKRAAMLEALEKIREQGSSLQKQKENGQVGMFDLDREVKMAGEPEESLPEVAEFSRQELLALEKELLGFYLTEHPLAPVMAVLSRFRSHQLFQVLQDQEVGKKIKIGVIVTETRVVLTRKDSREMAFVKLEDDTGIIEAVVFPKTYAQTKDFWQKDKVLLVEGRVESREDVISLLVENASLFDENTAGKEIDPNEIRLPANISSAKLMALNKLFQETPGEEKLTLVFIGNDGQEKRMPLPYGVKYDPELQAKMKAIIE